MLCIPIVARNTEEALDKIARANILADMLELRLDVMESFRLEDILPRASKPVIATYRSKKEGGKGSADYVEVKKDYEQARSTLGQLTKENESLKKSERRKWFGIGAAVLLIGLILGLVMGRRQKKRSSLY